MRTFNAGAGMHGGLSLEVTNDGGFIGTGQHQTAANSCELYVYKVNGCGDPEWYNMFGSAGDDGGRSVKQTADGGYIIAGLTHFGNGGYDIWLIKLDAAGNLTWNKTFGTTLDDYGLYVNTTSDGGYIITGFVMGGFGSTDVVLIKTDASGNMQWCKSYGGTGDDWGDYVAQTADGGYIVTGYTTSFGAGGPDVYMLKVDATGTLQWSKTVGTPSDDSPAWGNVGRITADGGYIVTSHTDTAGVTAGGYDVWIFKTDAAGNVQWSKTYGGAGDESSRYIDNAHDGGYIVCGYTNSWGSGLYDGYLLKIDSVGDLQWSKTYGSDSIDRAMCVKATKDGGYSVSMITHGFGATYVDPVFMKTDSAGFVGCNETVAGTIVNSFTPMVGSGAMVGIPNLAVHSPVFTPYTYTPIDNYLCFQCSVRPQFTAGATLACPQQAVDFYNTTNSGLRCQENWVINGVSTVGVDTLTYTFPTAGFYTVSLIGQCGHNSDTMSASVVIIPRPTCDFAFTNKCQDSVINFTDLSSAVFLTHLVKWSWDFGDGTTLTSVTDTNPTHQYASAGTYNVSLTVTDAVGCDTTVTKAVIAFPVPVAAFTFSDVCDFNAMQFTNTSTVATGSVSTFNWDFGDGNTSAVQSPSNLYPGPGQYQVMLAVKSDSGCPASVSHAVNVFPVPVAGFSVFNTCFGIASRFNDTSAISSGTIATYSWDFGDGNTSQLASPSHLYGAAGTYTADLVITSNNNCTDSVKHQVTIYPVPAAAFSFEDTCAGLPVSFTDQSTVFSGSISSWTWIFGDGAGSAQTNPVHTYLQPGAFSVQLVVYSDQQCVDSLSKPLTIYPNPVSNFTFSNACFGNPNIFTNSSTVLTGTITASAWTFGDGSNSAVTSPVYTYAAAGNYTVQLISTSDRGCVDTVQHPLQVYVKPQAGFGYSFACIGNPTQFTDSSTPAGQVTIWNWTLGDGNTSTVQNPSHVYSAAGNYNVQLIATTTNACSDTLVKPITVLGKGSAQFNTSNVCLNVTSAFTNNTTGTGTYPDSTWLWNFGDGTGTSSQMNPSYLYAAPGTYNVTLVAGFTDGCTDTLSQPVIVYVLPTISPVIKEVSCFGGSDGDITLTPVLGLTPFGYQWNNSASTNDNSSLSLGNYTVTFTDANQCTASAAYIITQPPLLVSDTIVRPIICYGSDNGGIAITVAGGTPPYNFTWNNGANTDSINGLAPGTYSVTVSDALGCLSADSATLIQPLLYQVLVDSELTIKLGEKIQISPVAVNGNPVSWEWSPPNFLSCTSCQSPIAEPYISIAYNVQTVSDQGCKAAKSVLVTVIPVYKIFVPNVFTPNGDGNNDFFEVFGDKDAWKLFSVQVFDRIGEMVFESGDMNFKWDGVYKGKPMPAGVLVYQIRVVYIDNHTDKLFTGSIDLLR